MHDGKGQGAEQDTWRKTQVRLPSVPTKLKAMCDKVLP